APAQIQELAMSKNEVFAIRVIGFENGTWLVLKDAEPTDLFGVRCIGGSGVTTDPSHWINGVRVCIPISQIQAIAVYDSLDQYHAKAKRYAENESKSRKMGQP